MDELIKAIEELREATKSREAILREFNNAQSALDRLSEQCDLSEQRQKDCALRVDSIVQGMAAEELPLSFRQ